MESNLVKLHIAVKEQTAKFKTYFMSVCKNSITNEYRSLPKKIDSANKKIGEIYLKEADIRKTYIDDVGRIISMQLFNEATPMLRPLWKERDKLHSFINRCKKLIALGEEKYVANELCKAEIMFDSKVFGLADRLNKRGFSPDDLKFSDISLDPKLFDVYITSGNSKIHARSILAAVGSECMVAHFRFIITNAK